MHKNDFFILNIFLIGYDILNNKYGGKNAIAMVNNLCIADVPPKNGEQNENPAM